MDYSKAEKQAKKNLESSHPQPKTLAAIGGCYGFLASAAVLALFSLIAGLDIKDFTQATTIVSIASFAVPYFILKKQHDAYAAALRVEIDKVISDTN